MSRTRLSYSDDFINNNIDRPNFIRLRKKNNDEFSEINIF